MGRFSEDKDPLDLVVFGENEKYWRQISFNTLAPEVVRVIGMIKMEECSKVPCKKESEWERDWKVLAVDIKDYLYKDVADPSELPSQIRTI